MHMEAFEKVNNVEDLFRQLEGQKFSNTVKMLSTYRKELMAEGFTRREAMRLVEAYSKFLYDSALEDIISERRRDEIDYADGMDAEEDFDDVDDEDDEAYS